MEQSERHYLREAAQLERLDGFFVGSEPIFSITDQTCTLSELARELSIYRPGTPSFSDNFARLGREEVLRDFWWGNNYYKVRLNELQLQGVDQERIGQRHLCGEVERIYQHNGLEKWAAAVFNIPEQARFAPMAAEGDSIQFQDFYNAFINPNNPDRHVKDAASSLISIYSCALIGVIHNKRLIRV